MQLHHIKNINRKKYKHNENQFTSKWIQLERKRVFGNESRKTGDRREGL